MSVNLWRMYDGIDDETVFVKSDLSEALLFTKEGKVIENVTDSFKVIAIEETCMNHFDFVGYMKRLDEKYKFVKLSKKEIARQLAIQISESLKPLNQ